MRRCFVSLLMLAVVAPTPASAAAGTDPAASEPFFFRVSAITAAALPALGATRYTVSVTNAPIGNAPFVRWYLVLRPGSTGAPCSNDVLAGGTKVGPDRWAWKNQGFSFVWYHGPEGSYASRRTYGCDQELLGRNGSPGTVSVVFENDSETCSASFAGIATRGRVTKGPDAVCQLGGYLPLPVPRALLRADAGATARLNVLLRRARTGSISGAQLANALRALSTSEADALRLFPPVWGCRFDILFSAVLKARTAFALQPMQTAAAMSELGATLHRCEATVDRPIGVPRSVAAAVANLASRSRAIAASRSNTAGRKLRDIAVALEQLIGRHFPVVLGIRYVDLVDRVLAEHSAAVVARNAASRGDSAAAINALAQIRRSHGATASELRKQAERSAKAEKAA